jgi:hypothetical protein
MTRRAAVLTGDLIASTHAGQAATDAAMAMIESVAKTENAFNQADVRFTRFRGDGWQIYCSDPTKVFRLSVMVLANLHGHPDLPKTRISAATGNVTFLPKEGLASASGEVFSVSGQTLDLMSTQRLVYQSSEHGWPWKLALFSYLEWQSARWSPEQAEAVSIAFGFAPPRPKSVAETLGISRQAAAARLQGAGFGPLADTEASFQTIPVGSPHD